MTGYLLAGRLSLSATLIILLFYLQSIRDLWLCLWICFYTHIDLEVLKRIEDYIIQNWPWRTKTCRGWCMFHQSQKLKKIRSWSSMLDLNVMKRNLTGPIALSVSRDLSDICMRYLPDCNTAGVFWELPFVKTVCWHQLGIVYNNFPNGRAAWLSIVLEYWSKVRCDKISSNIFD